jgi:transcription elongation factor Elf1
MASESDLKPDERQRVMDLLAQWRLNPERSYVCPRCGLEGLVVIDRSARPHAEWYNVTCAACTLEATINVPLGAPVPGAQD